MLSQAEQSLKQGHGPAGGEPLRCESSVGGERCALDSGVAIPSSGRAPLISSPAWAQLSPITSPSGRSFASMTYDGADGYVVLFGGNRLGALGDTWKFAGGNWTELSPTTSPGARYDSTMVYDEADGYVVLFGGCSWDCWVLTQDLGDTWKFVGGQWTNITPTISPSARFGASMAYDSADGYAVLFGGYSRSSPYVMGDTWKFVGGQWTNIAPIISPTARYDSTMVYDGADGYVMLFGGFDGRSDVGDTWKFLGGQWANISPTISPTARLESAMVYDVIDGYVVLFSGSNGFADTWKFLGGQWANITASISTSPGTRIDASMVYDSADGYVMLFSGSNDAADTWKFVGGGAGSSASNSSSSTPFFSGTTLLVIVVVVVAVVIIAAIMLLLSRRKARGPSSPVSSPAPVSGRRFCPKCGVPNDADAGFCEACGNRFSPRM